MLLLAVAINGTLCTAITMISFFTMFLFRLIYFPIVSRHSRIGLTFKIPTVKEIKKIYTELKKWNDYSRSSCKVTVIEDSREFLFVFLGTLNRNFSFKLFYCCV